ncbi:hypothetical protein VKS41_000357 [Umbelopsis sp. WA50703]
MLEKTALILVDIQNDFLETGSLPVPSATEILPVVNQLIATVKDRKGLVVATKDWHPQNHVSFASNTANGEPFKTIEIDYDGQKLSQMLWPDHCVQNSPGAEFAPGLDKSQIDIVVYKGTDSHVDSYSAFADNMYFQITELAKHLYTRHIETVIIVGLAADYCVKESALDARKFGFRTILVKDGTKPVVPENFDTCMSALAAKKVEIVGSNDEAFKAELLK